MGVVLTLILVIDEINITLIWMFFAPLSNTKSDVTSRFLGLYTRFCNFSMRNPTKITAKLFLDLSGLRSFKQTTRKN